MLMRPNKARAAVHGCHCPDDVALRVRKTLARPWFGVPVESLLYTHCVPIANDKRACARRPYEYRVVVLPYVVACCLVLLYFGDEDGRDYIHTTVRSLRTDRQRGPPLGQMETRLQYYIDARGITVDNRKRALLLHLAGPAVQDIFATLSDTGTSYMEALTALNTYFTPQKSLQFERHTFRQAHQAPNESISQYVTRLRPLGEHCDFDKYSLDEAIKDQLINIVTPTHFADASFVKNPLFLSVP